MKRAPNGKGLYVQFRLNSDSAAGKRWTEYREQGWEPRRIAERLLEGDQSGAVPLPDTLTGQVIERLKVNVLKLESIVEDIRANGGIATNQHIQEIGEAITAEFEENMRGNVKQGFSFEDE